MSPVTGFKPTKLETAALNLAWDRWQDFEAVNQQHRQALEEPDRVLFTQLGKAVRQLRLALDPFVSTPNNPEICRLAARLQEEDGFTQQQIAYREMLNSIDESLASIDRASRIEAGGPGRKADPYEQRWILVAADAWKQVVGVDPSSGISGRFFQYLTEFQRSHAAPPVTERNLRTSLDHWKTRKRSEDQQSAVAFETVPVTEDPVDYAIGCVLALSTPTGCGTKQQDIAAAASSQTRKVFGGDRLYIRRNNEPQKRARNNQICIEHTAGVSVPELCKRYDLSRSHVWKIIKEQP